MCVLLLIQDAGTRLCPDEAFPCSIGAGMVADQMDDQTLIIPSGPVASKAVINFRRITSNRRHSLCGPRPRDSYTTGTAALSRWGCLALHTKYPPLPWLSCLSLSLCFAFSHHLHFLHLPLFFPSMLMCVFLRLLSPTLASITRSLFSSPLPFAPPSLIIPLFCPRSP